MLDKSVRDAMPSNGFFPAYVRYARAQTDAPDIFHLGTALAMFSAVAARGSRMAIPLPGARRKDGKTHTVTPLHLWVLLVGPSGARKSTAIQIGSRMMWYEPPMRVEKSPEATFNRWSKESGNGTLGCHGLLCYPEASVLFDIVRKPWWALAEGFLCNVYDGLTMKRLLVGKATAKDGKRTYGPPIEIKIEGPRIAFLGGISPALLSVRHHDRVSGLLGRMMMLYGDRERLDVFPPLRREDEEQRLGRMFRKYALRQRTVDMKPESWAKFVAWAKALDRESGNYAPDKRAMMTRLPQHVLRVAALYRLSIPDDDGTVADVIDRALALGELAKGAILRLPKMEK